MRYEYIITTAVTCCFLATGFGLGPYNDSTAASFYPEKQTIAAQTCQATTISLRADANLIDSAIRVEKFNSIDYDYYFLFYKDNGERRLKENKKSGSLGHYPRYKPSFLGRTFQLYISNVVKEDEGVYLVSIRKGTSGSWSNSYVTLVVKCRDESINQKKKNGGPQEVEVSGEKQVDSQPSDKSQVTTDHYKSFSIVVSVLLILSVLLTALLVFCLWRTKREVKSLLAKSESYADKKSLLRDTEQDFLGKIKS